MTSTIEGGLEAAVRDLMDREAIGAVCVRYATALDQRDWSLLAECFEPDAVGDYGDLGRLDGYGEIERTCRAALEPLTASQHLVGNIAVDLDGDAARSTCAFQAQHVRPGTPGGDLFVVAGNYRDRFVRRDDGWRIAHRRIEVVWTDGNSAVLSDDETE
jgi:3-phenylpropionate/cinnamic acid dioxygenase small subunit